MTSLPDYGAGRAGAADAPGESWPQGLSHEPLLRVSDVLAALKNEFPGLSSSKLRFLDSQGLVCPERTASGYRHYSAADVERMRFVLRQQRDRFRPLSVIAEDLAALDEGRMRLPVLPRAAAQQQRAYLTADEVSRASGVDAERIAEIEAAGLIAMRMPGKYPADAVAVVTAAAAYVDAGGDLRSARALSRAADRERDGAGEGRAESAIALFAALLRGDAPTSRRVGD